eukprot:4319096-Prymnesium_polylepis.1
MASRSVRGAAAVPGRSSVHGGGARGGARPSRASRNQVTAGVAALRCSATCVAIAVNHVVVVVGRLSAAHGVAHLGARLALCVLGHVPDVPLLVGQRRRHVLQSHRTVEPRLVALPQAVLAADGHLERAPAVVLEHVEPVRVCGEDQKKHAPLLRRFARARRPAAHECAGRQYAVDQPERVAAPEVASALSREGAQPVEDPVEGGQPLALVGPHERRVVVGGDGLVDPLRGDASGGALIRVGGQQRRRGRSARQRDLVHKLYADNRLDDGAVGRRLQQCRHHAQWIRREQSGALP